jgi:CBS domain-containing protein
MSWIVADVMTRDVVTVSPETSFEACLRAMRLHGVGALPVVRARRVAGIVTMTDLLLKSNARVVRLTAEQLMTRRVIMVTPASTLSVAVREMFQHRINRLPVIDEAGRLVGIISRSDVLRMFLRSDVAIRKEVATTVAGDMPFIGKGVVFADVQDGVVTLQGEVEPGTLTGVLLRLVASVPGVVGVKNSLHMTAAKKTR